MKDQQKAATTLALDGKHATAASPTKFQPRTSPKKRAAAPVRKSGAPFQSGKRLKFSSASLSGRVDRINFPKHYGKASVVKVLLSTETGALKCT
jgi:hypothetical protein